jgi:hypothetical protein
VRIEAVGEVGLGTAGLKYERQLIVARQRPAPDGGRQAVGVPRRLPLDPGQGGADRFGFDDSDGFAVHVQQVVDAAVSRRHDELALSDALAGEEIQGRAVLDVPAGVGKLPVDEHARPLLGLKPEPRQRKPPRFSEPSRADPLVHPLRD